MSQNIQTSLRLTPELDARVDRMLAQMSADVPGITKAIVLRALIERGLEAEEQKRSLSKP